MRRTAIRSSRRAARLAGLLALWFSSGTPAALDAQDAARGAERLREIQTEVARLRAELRAIDGKERGVLGEIEALDAGLRLRRAELSLAGERIGAATAAIEARTAALAALDRDQGNRRSYLAFRMREIYKRGPAVGLRLLFGGEPGKGSLDGLRYAAYLNEKDRRIIRAFRDDAARLADERSRFALERNRLLQAQSDADAARQELARSRGERAAYLAALRRDRQRGESTLREMESASLDLSGLVGRIGGEPIAPLGSDPARLRGTLDWPVNGKILAGFGRMVHPQFKTVVPHPGLDLEAPAGSDIRAVLDGTVAYSAWLRGYGLTVILDHGKGLLSIYAHAAELLVASGDVVRRSQVVAKVGDTGSMRGAYLYFEMRIDGKPTDPLPWLRKR